MQLNLCNCKYTCPWLIADNIGMAWGRQKKSVTTVVGGWVRGQKRATARIYFSDIFCGVFEPPSPRSAQKHDLKHDFRKKKAVLDFLSIVL
jgi:hypothetical protein